MPKATLDQGDENRIKRACHAVLENQRTLQAQGT